MSLEIQHDEKKQLFFFEEEGKTGELKYYLEGKTMDLVHTYVPTSLRGEGHGDALMKAVITYATENGYKILPSCAFAEAYVERHSAARKLVAE